MRSLIAITMFALGVYLSMRTIAAFHRIIDLWYTIKTAYLKATRGILGWGGTTVAIAALLTDRVSPAFYWGLAAYLGFYLVVACSYFVWHLVLRKGESKRAIG